jgi:cellulose synthase/poly-beta-1,6-N-acetylglucosamine synthase-like glycosyltransferase
MYPEPGNIPLDAQSPKASSNGLSSRALKPDPAFEDNYLLRRSIYISAIICFFLALTDASTENWASLLFVPMHMVLLVFLVNIVVMAGYHLIFNLPILRDEKLVNEKSFANQPREISFIEPPTVTVQVPIYKESFNVIRIALDAAQKAIERYQEIGQQANLLISDDGIMMLTDNDPETFVTRARAKPPKQRTPEEREVLARLFYYAKNNLAWVARPKPISGLPETCRPGTFKKASNLNYTWHLASTLDEKNLIDSDKKTIRAELKDTKFRYARFSGKIWIGELILLIDKDSITHPEVIIKTVPEFLADSRLAYTQHVAYPINDADNLFSRYIGHFTRFLYDISIKGKAIMQAHVPLMGHNCFLRKSVLFDLGGWHNHRASEDFDIMMRMLAAGYHGKYIAFPGMEFGEVVTTSFHEEASKYQRYTFGVAESLLNPINQWERFGLLSSPFKKFLRSPHVKWFHVVDLLTFFCSLLNLAAILPATCLVAFGLISTNSVVTIAVIVQLMFLGFGLPLTVMVRRKRKIRNFSRPPTPGLTFSMITGHFVWGFFFVGYSLVCARGAWQYLVNKKPDWKATSIDESRGKKLSQYLKEMGSIHKDALILALFGITLLFVEYLRVGNLTPFVLVWFYPIMLHALIPYIGHPYLMRSLFDKMLFRSYRQKVPM